MKRFTLVLAIAFGASAETSPADVFPERWAKFSDAMNAYIDGLNHDLNRRDQLVTALRQWRRMEAEQGWNNIR